MNVLEMIEPRRVAIEEEMVIPADLSEWVTKDQLRDWVLEAVDGLKWNDPRVTELLKRDPAFEPRRLLAATAYAYLVGIFSAEDIVRACSRDASFRSVRPEFPPRAAEFSTFRRLHRSLITEIVAQVLTRALKTQFMEGDAIRFFPAGLRRMIVENAMERLNIARHMDRAGEA